LKHAAALCATIVLMFPAGGNQPLAQETAPETTQDSTQGTVPTAAEVLALIESKGSYAFAAAAADLEESRAKVNAARASLFPSLNLTAKSKRLESKKTVETRNSETASKLELVQPIYDFGLSYNRIRAARTDAKAAEEKLRAARNLVLLEGLAIFYDLHASESLLHTLSQDHAHAYVRWERAQERQVLKKSDPVEVAEKLARVETSRLSYYRERSRNNLLRLRLEDLTGLTIAGELYDPPPPPAKKPPEVDLDKLIAFAEKRNPELITLVQQAEALGLLRAGTGTYPKLEAFGNVGTSTREWRSREEWAVGARLSWPIFDGGIKSAERAGIAARKKKVLAALEIRRRELRRELRKAVLSRADSWQQVIAARAKLDFEDRALTRRKRQYDQERVSDLGRAMVTFTQAETDLIKSTGAYYVDSARLALLLGESPGRGIEPNFLGSILGKTLTPESDQFTPKGGSGFGQQDQNTIGR